MRVWLARFGRERGTHMIRCHNLTHEDHDMKHQFQVGGTDPSCEHVTVQPAITGTPWDR
jgi:hypothetical protein